MASLHTPPAGLKDFDRGQNPQDLYKKWDAQISALTAPSPEAPAWYDPLNPPVAGAPAGQAPPWTALPRNALLLNNNDVLAAATAVDDPVEFGSGIDALLVNEPPFLDASGNKLDGFKYRPQDEYLEWVTKKDADGVVREIWFTCEGPEYWQLIGDNDHNLLIELYAEMMSVPKGQIDPNSLFFSQDCSHAEVFAGGQVQNYSKGQYNPFNSYNISSAIHLTQGANTLGAEITLAMQGSLIWGTPPKTSNPDLICCAEYGDPNRFSDPTIGKEVNDLARQNFYVTLRDPIGLYIDVINGANFTDENGNAIPNIGDYFVRTRGSNDGSMTVRAIFKVPTGVLNNAGSQARVGDLRYLGKPITKGGQVAHAITMHLFAQALPGAPAQTSQPCTGHACFDASKPGFVVLTDINKPCQGAPGLTFERHLALANASFKVRTRLQTIRRSRVIAR